MSEMLVHVLIQTAITFEILKTYRGFYIFLSIKVCTLRLCRLKVSARSQVLKSVKMKAISSHRSITINNINQDKFVFILTLVKYFSCQSFRQNYHFLSQSERVVLIETAS